MGCATSLPLDPTAEPTNQQSQQEQPTYAPGPDGSHAAGAASPGAVANECDGDAAAVEMCAASPNGSQADLDTASIAVRALQQSMIGGVALAQIDGTYLAKECEGLVQLASPALHSVLRKLVFVVSSAAAEFQPSAVACLVLDACYRMWNSSLSKSQWTGEFMLYLKLIESELVHGQAVFRRPGFLAVLERQLRACQTKLAVITARTPVASFLFASTDEDDLLRLTASLEAIKAQALQGMLADVKDGMDQTNAALTAMLADLQRKQTAGFEADPSATGSAFVEGAMLRSMRRLAEDARLKAALGLQDHAADVARLSALFVDGTRADILHDFEVWLTYHEPPSTSAAAASAAALAPAPDASASASTPPSRPYDEGRDRFFWVEAGPGVGKSVLAAALCTRYPASVCALHFCTPMAPGGDAAVSPRNDPFAIVKSICAQLAQRVPAYRSWLLAAIDANTDQLRDKLAAAAVACSVAPGANAAAAAASAAAGPRFPSLRKMVEEMLVRPLHGVHAAAVRSGDLSGLPDCVRGVADVVVVDAPAAPAAAQPPSSSSAGMDAQAPVPSAVHFHPTGPRKLLILIDALDESFAPEPRLSASPAPVPAALDENDLARALGDFACRLPPWVGLVLTSGAGSRVRRGLEAKCAPREIDARGAANLADADKVVRATVPAGVDDAAVQAVVERSEGMLLYVAMVLASGRGEALAQPQALAAELDCADADLGSEYWLPALQRLYVAVERAADADPLQPAWEAHHAVLRAVMAAQKEMAALSLEQLGRAVPSDLVPSPGHLQRVLDRAYPLLSVRDGTVRPVHASLRSWLQSGERQFSDQELPFYCAPADAF